MSTAFCKTDSSVSRFYLNENMYVGHILDATLVSTNVIMFFNYS